MSGQTEEQRGKGGTSGDEGRQQEAELCGRGRTFSARRTATGGRLGDRRSNKKSRCNDFSRKVHFKEIKPKQLLVSLESVRPPPCSLSRLERCSSPQMDRCTPGYTRHQHVHMK